jgi:hypothetical protein
MITDDRKEALEKIWGEEVYPEVRRRLSMRDARNEAEPDPRRELAIILHGIAMSMELAAQGRPFARIDKCLFEVRSEISVQRSERRHGTGR